MVFKPNWICKTCQFIKPARSKHCSVCNVCVDLMDHHCPWLNNCIGKNTIGEFNRFITLHVILSISIFLTTLYVFLTKMQIVMDSYLVDEFISK